MSKCPLCALGNELSESYRSKLIFGELDAGSVARTFNMSVAEVMRHAYDHGSPIDVKTLGFDYYDQRMRSIFRKFNDWMNVILEESTPSERTVKMASSLAKELREILRLMGEFEGKVGDSKYKQQAEDAERKLRIVTDVILREACPTCKLKLMRALETGGLIR